jgi:tetratricopeptide (TPR) repeat protein
MTSRRKPDACRTLAAKASRRTDRAARRRGGLSTPTTLTRSRRQRSAASTRSAPRASLARNPRPFASSPQQPVTPVNVGKDPGGAVTNDYAGTRPFGRDLEDEGRIRLKPRLIRTSQAFGSAKFFRPPGEDSAWMRRDAGRETQVRCALAPRSTPPRPRRGVSLRANETLASGDHVGEDGARLRLGTVTGDVQAEELESLIPRLTSAGDFEELYRVGVELDARGRWEAAERALRRAARAGVPGALNQLGHAIDFQGRLGEAEAIYRQAIDEGDELAILNLGDMLLPFADRRSESEALLREAVALHVPSAYFALGKLLARWPGREQEAEAALRAEDNPDVRRFAQLVLGTLLRGMPGRETAAEAALKAAGSPEADMELGSLLAAMSGRTDDAIAALRRAADAGVENAWNNLTVLLKESERWTEAEAAYRTAIARGEDALVVHYGQLLFTLGRAGEAEEVLQRGIAGDPLCAYLLGAILVRSPSRNQEGRELLRHAASRGVPEATIALADLGALGGGDDR